MSKTIKSSGGIATRLIETINGFKTKYGYWPDTILADSSTISVLATQCLTPLGFFLVQSKIDITIGDDGFILAKGRNCDSFDYGDEGWQNNGGNRLDPP